MKFLYLSEPDMIKCDVLNMSKCIATIEEMLELLRIGDYRMSGASNNDHGARVKFPEQSIIPNMPLSSADRWFTTMPAYLGGRFHMFGIKSYGSNHDNAQLGLPRSILMMSLLDVDTGAPLAYMSANILSAMRTGAIAGVGAKYLSSENPSCLSVIGPGVMSRYAVYAIMTVFPQIRKIKVYGRGATSLNKFKSFLENKYNNVVVSFCSDIKSVCEDADIIFTGNSRSERFEDNPYISEDYLKKGCLVISSSAVRFDNDFLIDSDKCVCVADFNKIYETGFDVDSKPTTSDASDQVTFNIALHNMFLNKTSIVNLPDVIKDVKFRRDPKKVYIYGAYGMPVEDVAWGFECYQNAIKKEIGTNLLLWEESEL